MVVRRGGCVVVRGGGCMVEEAHPAVCICRCVVSRGPLIWDRKVSRGLFYWGVGKGRKRFLVIGQGKYLTWLGRASKWMLMSSRSCARLEGKKEFVDSEIDT